MRKIKKLLVAGVAGTMLATSVMGVSAAGLRDIFSAKYYAEKYKDLKEAFEDDEEALYNHFLTYGIKEGRVMNPVLDIVKYRDAYGDLDEAFADNWDAYVEHYFTHGMQEKRVSGGTFDPVAYAEAYPDIKEAFGDDYKSIIDHYLSHGIQEGRTAGVTVTAASQPEEQSQSEPAPTGTPTPEPTVKPSATPTVKPSATPTVKPSATPTVKPGTSPEASPEAEPTVSPSPTAAPEVAKVGTEAELRDALTNKTIDIKVTADIELSSRLTVGRNATIDLDGHKISRKTSSATDINFVLSVDAEEVTIIGGSIVTVAADDAKGYAIDVRPDKKLRLAGTTVTAANNAIQVRNGATLIVGPNTKVTGTDGYAVFVTDRETDKDGNYTDSSYRKTSVEVNEGTLEGRHGLTVNGNRTIGDSIVIDGGTVSGLGKSDKADLGEGLFLSGVATTIIKGNATISGKSTGIELRAGTLEIGSGVTVKGGYNQYVGSQNNGGQSVDGVALAVSQHSTRHDIIVKVAEGATLVTASDTAVVVTDTLVKNTAAKGKVEVELNCAIPDGKIVRKGGTESAITMKGTVSADKIKALDYTDSSSGGSGSSGG